MGTPHKRSKPANKAITVRLPVATIEKLMRARNVATHSELINRLLEEEEERLEGAAALRATTATARAGDFEDRLL